MGIWTWSSEELEGTTVVGLSRANTSKMSVINLVTYVNDKNEPI